MAKTVTKGIDLYRETLALLESTRATAMEGHRLLAEAGEEDLKHLLSGTLTPKQTRGAFARGATSALSTPTGRRRQLTDRQKRLRGLKVSGGGGYTKAIPLNPVNVQSRRLLEGVTLRRKVGGRARQEMDLEIDGVPYAKYVLAVGGTRFMVGRQVQAELKRAFGPRNKAFVDYFVRNAAKP